MKGNVLEYKGYRTCINYESETNTLRGVIEGINDYVDFESDDISKVAEDFHNAVDDYLDFCSSIGKEPEKEYKGSFNIRIKPELHKELALKAALRGESINKTVERAIDSFLNANKVENNYHLDSQNHDKMWGSAKISEPTTSKLIFFNAKDTEERERM